MQTTSPEQPAVRTRITTIWLWLIVILNVIIGLLVLLPISIVTALFSLGVAVGAYMILQWKKMGFYIVVGCEVLSVLVTIFVGGDLSSIVGAVISIAILYYVLQYPKDNKAWNHLA